MVLEPEFLDLITMAIQGHCLADCTPVKLNGSTSEDGGLSNSLRHQTLSKLSWLMTHQVSFLFLLKVETLFCALDFFWPDHLFCVNLVFQQDCSFVPTHLSWLFLYILREWWSWKNLKLSFSDTFSLVGSGGLKRTKLKYRCRLLLLVMIL